MLHPIRADYFRLGTASVAFVCLGKLGTWADQDLFAPAQCCVGITQLGSDLPFSLLGRNDKTKHIAITISGMPKNAGCCFPHFLF